MIFNFTLTLASLFANLRKSWRMNLSRGSGLNLFAFGGGRLRTSWGTKLPENHRFHWFRWMGDVGGGWLSPHSPSKQYPYNYLVFQGWRIFNILPGNTLTTARSRSTKGNIYDLLKWLFTYLSHGKEFPYHNGGGVVLFFLT